MIASIAAKEMRALLRDGRLWGLGLVLVSLLAAVLVSAVHQRQVAEQERQQVGTAARAQWDHQGDRNPHRAAHFGLYAFKPQLPLASVDPGINARTGQALWLEPHKRNMALHAPVADAAPSMGLGDFTPAFVLLAMVPLLIAVLGHGAVAQEREQGTLRMLHACGMRGVPLVLGKWLGLCASVALVLAPAALVAGWLLAARQGAAEAAMLLAALGAYYATWAAVSVGVSTRCRTSRGALLVLLALWVGWVFIVPRLAASTVEALAPLPTGEAFWAGIQRDIDQGLPGEGSAAQRMKAFDAQLLADNGVARLEGLPFGANAKRRLFRDAYATKVYAQHFGQLWHAQAQQQYLLRWLTAVSPYAPMRAVSSALAGTDLAHQQHFEEAAEQYRERFTTLVDEWDLQATQGVTSFESRYAGNALWQAIPAWTYTPPGIGFALRHSAADWVALGVWLLAALTALCLGARKLNP
ncbi:ABC transporter permease [Acidovorax sp.]|uniref:ABC transporter permease n=1 Tax=Acidovorax sp. TaxID=1872122 RepID=UPI00391C86B7